MALKPNTYTFPKKARWTSLLKVVPLYVLTLAALGFMIWVGVAYGAGGGLWTSIACFVISVGMATWATYWHFHKYPHAKFVIDEVTVLVEDWHFYIPPEVYRDQILVPVREAFARYYKTIATDTKMLSGTKVKLVRNKPRHYLLKGERVGITFPGRRISRVWAPYSLELGTMGYELKLILCHGLFPGRPEGEDIEWMKSEGLL